MFESAELGHKIDKETYEKEEPELRESLLNAQFEMAEAPTFPVIILVVVALLPPKQRPEPPEMLP